MRYFSIDAGSMDSSVHLANIFAPLSMPAQAILELSWLVLWIEPRAPGIYLGQCAEYCGTQHANMLLRVIVHARGDFERWAER